MDLNVKIIPYIKEAMDIFAKQQAIEFHKACIKDERFRFYCEETGELNNGYSGMSIEESYDEFLKKKP